MNSAKTSLIVLLTLTTLGGAFVAWRQHGELAGLRTAAMTRSERAAFQKRVWDLEKNNRELRDRGAGASSNAAGAGGGPTAGEITARAPRPEPRRDSEPQLDALRGLLNRPEFQSLLSIQQKGTIDARYAPLFKNLTLSSGQIEKLKSLLAERTTTMLDVLTVARDQGVDPRDNPAGFSQLAVNAQNEINQSIRGVIGDQGFAQLTNFEQTLPQRALVNELQQRLSYTTSPLTGAQAEQLVQILTANSMFRAMPGSPVGGAARGVDPGAMLAGLVGNLLSPGGPDTGRGGGTIVTATAVTQSQTVLAPPQVAALQQLQQQQQAQLVLRQIVSDTLSATQAPPTSGNPAPAPPAAARKGGKQ